MNTEIYLRIIKDMHPDDDPTTATIVAKMMSPIPLPGVIGGDSLDIPFIKWIKLTGFKNSIGYSGGMARSFDKYGDHAEHKFGKIAPDYKVARGLKGDFGNTEVARDDEARTFTQTRTRENRFGGTESESRTRKFRRGYRAFQPEPAPTKYTPTNWRPRLASFDNSKLKTNAGLNIDLPQHGDVSFTKAVDNATPQLAYACSCQEPIGTAMVLFRRRIGLGVRGIRVPYLAILLSQCLISSWDLDGDSESVSMSYGRVRWCTYDQIADFNVATGMSARWWDTDGNGGESMKMYLIMGAIAVAAMAGAAIDTGVSAGLGRPDSSSFSGSTPTARGDVSMIS